MSDKETFNFSKAKDFNPESEVLSKYYAEFLMEENAYLKKKLKQHLLNTSRLLSFYQTKVLEQLTEE